MAMRKGGRAPETYRGVAYSVAKKTEGLWTWTLHPRAEQSSPVISEAGISGTAKGMNQNAAVDAAHRAIDKMLGTTRR
jgi:hypothetical protein